MDTKVKAHDIIYANRLTNIVYYDGDILETNLINKDKDNKREHIFDVFARVLVRNNEQRKVFHHIMFDKEAYTRQKICKKCSLLYNKSEKTFQRAVDGLFGKRIITQDKYKILHVPIEYNLALLDLDNVKSIIIHIE